TAAPFVLSICYGAVRYAFKAAHQVALQTLGRNRKMLSPLLLLVVFALALLGWAAVRRVPEGQVYTVRRLDGHLRTVGSGTRFMLPLVERVARKTRLTGASTTVDGLADVD